MNKIINTRNLIYLTILGSPLYLVRFNFFSIPTNILEILIGITFVIWVFERKKYSLQKIDFNVLLPITLLLLGVFVSILTNDSYQVGFGILKSWFIFPIIFGFIVHSTTRTDLEIKKILDYIFASTFLVSVVSLFYYLSGNLTFDGRLSSIYLSPNHLAMFLAPGFIIGILGIAHTRNRNILWLGIIFMSPIIYWTYSYATWVSLFITIFTFILFSPQFKNNYKKIFLTFLVSLLLIIFLQKDNSKFQALVNLESRSSLSSRIMIWKSSLKVLSHNWAIGIGPGNFQDKYLEYQKYFPPYLEWAVPQPHNLYLAFWLQGGILGIIGFLWLIYIWFRDQMLFLKNSKNKKQLTIILLAVMTYYLVHGLVDTPYWKNDLSFIFWIIIFLGLSKSKPLASLEQKLLH